MNYEQPIINTTFTCLYGVSSRFWEFKFSYRKNQVHVFENSNLHIERIKFMFLRIQVRISKESSSCFWEFKFVYWKNEVGVSKESSLNILIIVTFLIPCTQWRAWQGIELSNFYHCSEVWGRCQKNWWGLTLAEGTVYSSLLVLSTLIIGNHISN